MIRKVTLKDIPEIIRVGREEWDDFDYWFDEDYVKYLLKRHSDFAILYEENGKISGIVMGRGYSKGLVYLELTVVSKKHRNKRIGTELLKKIEEICKRKGFKFITTDTEAVKFYLKNKYKVSGYADHGREKVVYVGREFD